MKNAVWTKALKACAVPERASHFLDLLAATDAKAKLQRFNDVSARILAALFSGSQALSNALVRHPDWLSVLEPEALRFARRKQGFSHELQQHFRLLLEAGDHATAMARLREFKNRELLRVGARDLARLGKTSEIIQELSDLADVCLEAVWDLCWQQLAQRYGQPYHLDASGHWQATVGCVIGLGKLGGQELNYSSDVDVIFAYSDEGEVYREPPQTLGRQPEKGETPSKRSTASKRHTSGTTPLPRPVLKNHQFFNRLAEAFIAEVTRMAPEGTLYRIDLRLRPEGNVGPLSRALASFENYYAQWGQTWERMMLIKARGVAGDQTLAAEFLELIQPFRYPRSINESVLREIGTMKDRIENEVVRAGELERNVKLGRGGIREVEFIVQSLQLLHAGRQPFLQGAQTLPVLDKLVQYERLQAEAAKALHVSYCFLRDVEHRVQMEDNRQTHTVPSERSARERLARLMGFPVMGAFDIALANHMGGVRGLFETLLRSEVPSGQSASPHPREFDGAEAEWKALLLQHSFKDADKAFRVLREFVEGPGYVHISPRTRELAYQLLPRLFALCSNQSSECTKSSSRCVSSLSPSEGERARGEGSVVSSVDAKAPLSDPDRVVTRLDSFINAYGARATLFELWDSNPGIFELLLLLFDRSEFLAELAIRTPDLVDELVTSGRLRQRKSAEETLRDLRHGLRDADQHLWLRQYHQAELMRIGLRDILGLADFEQYLTELSALADACLRYALEVIMRRHKLKSPPFTIIGLGKLGGAEIDYGSDLDIVFVCDSKTKNLSKLSRLAVEVMDLISTRTEQGLVFHMDARLRPDGEKGLLVNTLLAYHDYYRHRAQLWEIQTLTRTRPIAGDVKVGEEFQKLAAVLTNFAKPSLPLAGYAADWKSRIHHMRMRIEHERTPRGKNDLAIKTGSGGLMDAEFIAQALCMEHGWQEANTLRALERARKAGVLPGADVLVENYRRLRRVEGILRRWSYEGESVLPDEPAPYFRVSVRCGFASVEAFREAIAQWRKSVREVYQTVFEKS